LVWNSDVEVPCNNVVGNDRGLAAIVPRAAFISDLGFDAGEVCQPGDAVRRAKLTLVAQVIMQLAIT
jgi:hypothetical protein